MEAIADYWRGVHGLLQPHPNLMLLPPARLEHRVAAGADQVRLDSARSAASPETVARVMNRCG